MLFNFPKLILSFILLIINTYLLLYSYLNFKKIFIQNIKIKLVLMLNLLNFITF
jgi:hypothetical protein